jgi:copper chaperone
MTRAAAYSVPGMSCGHCSAAITAEVTAPPGVDSVEVDLDAKLARISGEPRRRSARRRDRQGRLRGVPGMSTRAKPLAFAAALAIVFGGAALAGAAVRTQ